MRLANGLVLENEATFGELKFSALHGERFVENADGELTTEVKHRTYDLKCGKHRCMIQVILDGRVPLKEFGMGNVMVNRKA